MVTVRDADASDLAAIAAVHAASVRGLAADEYDDEQVASWSASTAGTSRSRRTGAAPSWRRSTGPTSGARRTATPSRASGPTTHELDDGVELEAVGMRKSL